MSYCIYAEALAAWGLAWVSVWIAVFWAKADINTSIKGWLIESTNTLWYTWSSLIISDKIRRAISRSHTRLSTIIHEIIIRAYIYTKFTIFISIVWTRRRTSSTIRISPSPNRTIRSHDTRIIPKRNIGKQWTKRWLSRTNINTFIGSRII